MTYKVCAKCGINKPSEEFWERKGKSKTRKDGSRYLMSYCKECMRARYNKVDKPKVIEKKPIATIVKIYDTEYEAILNIHIDLIEKEIDSDKHIRRNVARCIVSKWLDRQIKNLKSDKKTYDQGKLLELEKEFIHTRSKLDILSVAKQNNFNGDEERFDHIGKALCIRTKDAMNDYRKAIKTIEYITKKEYCKSSLSQ